MGILGRSFIYFVFVFISLSFSVLNPVSVFASQSSEPAPVEKRGPGRPPGSKNKPKCPGHPPQSFHPPSLLSRKLGDAKKEARIKRGRERKRPRMWRSQWRSSPF